MADTSVATRRRQGIYGLVGFCTVFFIGSITVSYVVAAHYGFGTGFGDSRPAPVGTIHGQGFFGDAAILAGAFALDVLIVYAWYWLISRLDTPTDEEVPAFADDVDLADDENWYAVQVPRLTKFLTGVALFCLVGVALVAPLNLPIVVLRYGW